MRSKARAPRRAFVAAALAVAMGAASAAADPQLCFACHGENGNSTNPAVPSLAGQPAQFIGTQLVMFREKQRQDPQMAPVAAALSNADISALGKFFAAQPRQATRRTLPEEALAQGRRLTEQFNCVACHGPALIGQQHIPRLAGQQAVYLRAQLQGFKNGTRFDMDGNMTSAARALQPADIDALADYLSSLQ